MTDFEKVYNFENLYKAHKKSRLGKRNRKRVIDFEMNLSENLIKLSEDIKNKKYKVSDYYHFKIYDPKERTIDALYYRDRVALHCLCDEVLVPNLDKKLIYDNAACRVGKGTHFAINRLTGFIRNFYKKNGTNGYFLKCDIRKYFDYIDHDVLKEMLYKNIEDKDVMNILNQIIDSHEKSKNKGIPLGNQTSQWFGLLYLNPLDRLIKEKLHIKYYTRYMDDCILIHKDKEYLKKCLQKMRILIEEELHLEFNEKTNIFPLKNGVTYLGWHFYVTETGKIIRKVSNVTKKRYKKKLKKIQEDYADNKIDMDYPLQVLASYRAHLSHGNTYHLQEKVLSDFVLQRKR